MSLLVALGLAPGCDDISCESQPCLNVPEPRIRKAPLDATTPPRDPEDEKKPRFEPCLSQEPEPPPVHPCLTPATPPKPEPKPLPVDPCLSQLPELKPCLSKPVDDPPLHPCLSVEPAGDPKPGTPKGGMARLDVLESLRARDVLPPDVLARLSGKSGDA